MNHNKKAVILVNVGSPDQPKVKYVRKYLTEFLNDRRVIDLPLLLQKFLVNLIIIPFRKKKSTRLYKMLWTDEGSPLIYIQQKVASELNKLLGDEYKVFSVMRYGNPSFKLILDKLENDKFHEIIVVPLYPQYASSTTGSVVQLAMNKIQYWNVIPKISFIDQFYNSDAYINAFVERAQQYDLNDYDHFVFSYHGLPDRHINKIHPAITIDKCNCTEQMPLHGTYCYKATCYATTRLLASRLNIPANKYTVSFQSRLSKNWLTPFTNEILIEKAKSGIKNILVFCPAFVTDCLETIIEIGFEYKELFEQNGGKNLTMVESLNDSQIWVEGLKTLILDRNE